MENAIICLSVVCGLLFSSGTVGPWPSAELSKLNATDGGVFNGSLTTAEESWIGSLATLGSMAGTILAGFLVEAIGRKWTLLILPAPLIIAYLFLAFSKNIYPIYFARFLSGIPMGSLYVSLPLYTGEIAKNEDRGRISGMFGFFVHLSHILTYAAGPYMTLTSFNIMLAIFPLLYIPFFIFFGVESPHYYIQNNKDIEAKATLKKIRNKAQDKEIEEEFKYLKLLIETQEHGSILDVIRHRGTRRALFMVLGLFTFCNLSGVLTLQTYAQQIFEASGTKIHPEMCAIILGVVQLISAALMPYLLVYFGRKTLALFSTVLTCTVYLILAMYLYLDDHQTLPEYLKDVPLIAVISAVVCSSVGMTPVPIIFLSEVFPNSVKSPAASLCACYCWILSFTVAKIFPILTNALGQMPVFFAFGCVCLVAIPFNLVFVKETRGKNLKEILDMFNK